MSDDVVVVWTVVEGVTTEVRFDGRLWVPKDGKVVVGYRHSPKQPYVLKWIKDTRGVGDVFALSDFYSVYPKHEHNSACKKRVASVISGLIGDGVLRQLGKDRFEVLKE